MYEVAVSGSRKAADSRNARRRVPNDRCQQPLETRLVLAAAELPYGIGKAEELSRWLPRKFQPWQLFPADRTRCPCRSPPQPTLPAAEGAGLRRPVGIADKRIAAGAGNNRREPAEDAQCRLVGDFEPQVELVCGESAARGVQQEAGLEPFVQRHVAAFEHRADRGAELLAAAAAEFQTRAGALSRNRANAVGRAAAPAHRAIRPDDFLELSVSGLLIPKIGLQSD